MYVELPSMNNMRRIFVVKKMTISRQLLLKEGGMFQFYLTVTKQRTEEVAFSYLILVPGMWIAWSYLQPTVSLNYLKQTPTVLLDGAFKVCPEIRFSNLYHSCIDKPLNLSSCICSTPKQDRLPITIF